MKTKIAAKLNISSLQVLKTLLRLFEDNYTMSELVTILNNAEKYPVFNNTVILKYINTLRFCGFNISKVNNRYYLLKIPFGIDLSNKDFEYFEYLNHIVQTRMSKKNNMIFNEFIERLNKYSNKGLVKFKEENSKIIFEDFENAIRDRRTVTFILKNKKTIDCIPIRLINDKKPVQFLVSEKGKEKLISSNTVAAINTTSFKYHENFTQQVVLFKITGGLAKRYTLRDTEQLVEKKDDFIIVSNPNEPKEILLNRLLKYDYCCEIISPKTYRKDMLELLNATLKNYGEE